MFIVMAWIMIIFPSNSNRQVELPTVYNNVEACDQDFTNQVPSYVAANGGDVRHTRATCVEQK